MPTISRKIIKRTHKLRRCDECGRLIEPGSTCLRLYGNGMRCDPKYNLYIHVECPK